MDEQFWYAWNEALEHFTVLQHRVSGLPGNMTRYIHAEAHTGSKYEFLGQEVQIDWRNPHDPSYVITVLNPWQNAWTTTYGSYLHVDYVLEHWRSPHRSKGEMHGGDAAALVVGLNMVNGKEIADAVNAAYYMMPKEWIDAH